MVAWSDAVWHERQPVLFVAASSADCRSGEGGAVMYLRSTGFSFSDAPSAVTFPSRPAASARSAIVKCFFIRASVRQHDVAEHGVRHFVTEERFVTLAGQERGDRETRDDILDRKRTPRERERGI